MRALVIKAGYPQEAFTNSLRIADSIEDYGFKLGKHMIPLFRDRYGVQWESGRSHEKLVMACMAGAERLGLFEGPNASKYLERLNMELGTIGDKNFSSYFLIIADIINYIRTLDTIPPLAHLFVTLWASLPWIRKSGKYRSTGSLILADTICQTSTLTSVKSTEKLSLTISSERMARITLHR
jgi:hypothetical protein